MTKLLITLALAFAKFFEDNNVFKVNHKDNITLILFNHNNDTTNKWEVNIGIRFDIIEIQVNQLRLSGDNMNNEVTLSFHTYEDVTVILDYVKETMNTVALSEPVKLSTGNYFFIKKCKHCNKEYYKQSITKEQHDNFADQDSIEVDFKNNEWIGTITSCCEECANSHQTSL
jgi:hypothetical protein